MTDLTNTDRATERLAEALHKESVACTALDWDRMAVVLTAQGFGHRDDIVRAYEKWSRNATDDDLTTYVDEDGGVSTPVDRYLASLAAKEEER